MIRWNLPIQNPDNESSGALKTRGPERVKFQTLNYKACIFDERIGLLNLEELTSSIRPQLHAILSTLQLRKGKIPVNSPWGVGLGVEDWGVGGGGGDRTSKAN